MFTVLKNYTKLQLSEQFFFVEFKRFVSYKHMGCSLPLLYKTIGKVLDEAAEKFGDKTALVSMHQNQRLSFNEVKEKSEQLAAGLLSYGIKPGDRVALWSPNSVEWYISSFALAKAGFISVYLNPSSKARELKYCLQVAEVKALLTAESFKQLNYSQILEKIDPVIPESIPGNLQLKDLPDLKIIINLSDSEIPGMISLKNVFERSSKSTYNLLKELGKSLLPENATNIQFTSGTTGSPKGAILSHFNVVNNSFFIGRRQELYLKEHILCLMGPFFHALGSVIGILNCLHHGTTLVVPGDSFNALNAVKAIINEKCTILLGTPTMFIDVLKIMEEKSLEVKTPELAITGGAPSSTSLFLNMLKTFKLTRVASVYGLTETGPVAFMSQVDDGLDVQTSTVGLLMDHFEALVVDGDQRPVPWDTPGELWVRGYGVMKGYWNDESKTRDTITSDQWLRTGDKFILSENGYGKVVGRIKDMILRGGENIYPAELEEFLSTHPDILEVQVIGLPDERLGEKVCACIRLKPNRQVSEDDIKNFCKEQISDFKIPQYIWFVEKFPRTTSGKVQKYVLKSLAINHFKDQLN